MLRVCGPILQPSADDTPHFPPILFTIVISFTFSETRCKYKCMHIYVRACEAGSGDRHRHCGCSMLGRRPAHRRTDRKGLGAYHQTPMHTSNFVPISKPAAPAPQSRRESGPGCHCISVAWLQREPSAQATPQPRRGPCNCRCRPSRPTPPGCKAGPQEDRATQQGQQTAKAARPGAAPTHTCAQHKQATARY